MDALRLLVRRKAAVFGLVWIVLPHFPEPVDDLRGLVLRRRRAGVGDDLDADALQLAFKEMQAQFIVSRDRLREELEQIATR